MQKTNPAWIIVGAVGVLIIGVLVVVSVLGKKKTSASPEASVAVSAEPSYLDLQAKRKAQLEHRAMTQRAMAAMKEQEKEKAQSAKEGPSQPRKAAAKRRSGPPRGPAPRADKLEALGKDIESALE